MDEFKPKEDSNLSQKDPNSSQKDQKNNISHSFRDETTFDLNSNDINKDDLVTKNDLDTKSDMGIERKKGFVEKIVDENEKDSNLSSIDANKDDLLTKNDTFGGFDTKSKAKNEGGNEKDSNFNFNSLVKEIKKDFDTKKKGFGETLVDGNDNNLSLSSNSVNMGTKDLKTNNSFVAFDYTDSENKNIRSFEELEDKNGNSKGKEKGDNFELSSGEISGNSKGNGDNFELSSGEISGNSKGNGDNFELSSGEISGNSKGKGDNFELSSGEISGNSKGNGDNFELSSGEISGNSKGNGDNFELSSGEISGNSKGKGDNFELSSGEISGNSKGNGDNFELSSGEISGNSKGNGDNFELSSGEISGNSKGKGDNFELSSGEISGNSKGNGDNFELSSGEISGNSKGNGDNFELSSGEISGNSKGKGDNFELSSGEISGNSKGNGDNFELSSGEISGNSKGNGDNFELSSGEISSFSVVDSASTKSRGCETESFDYNASEKRKKRFAKKLEVLKEKKENNHVNVTGDRANDDELVVSESSSGFLLGFASFVIKAIGWQLSLLVTFVIFPIKFLYKAYMFVSDPFQIKRRIRSTLFKIFRVVCGKFVSIAGESLKDHQSMSQLALRFGWGFLWAAYVCTVLVTLLISGFLLSGVVMRKLVDEPIQMKEALTFDYTKNSPAAFVPIISCPVEPYDVPFAGKSDVGDIKSTRVIPRNHKLQATVSLVLPESDYNRNLGVFQVRLDLLSVNGRTLASMRHPSMLHFSSQPIRMLLTFFKVAPLVTGYSSESQTLNINLRGLTEGNIPTACLRVIIEQRAEFRPGAGIPEIYDASLTLESELPLVKKLMWLWKKTLFIWLGLSMFLMQLLLALICCRPLIWPKGRVAEGSAGNIAPQNDHPAQR